MNQKQRDDFAKYLWDLSKITFTILVIGQLAKREEFTTAGFLGGVGGTTAFLLSALWLRRKRKK